MCGGKDAAIGIATLAKAICVAGNGKPKERELQIRIIVQRQADKNPEQHSPLYIFCPKPLIRVLDIFSAAPPASSTYPVLLPGK